MKHTVFIFGVLVGFSSVGLGECIGCARGNPFPRQNQQQFFSQNSAPEHNRGQGFFSIGDSRPFAPQNYFGGRPVTRQESELEPIYGLTLVRRDPFTNTLYAKTGDQWVQVKVGLRGSGSVTDDYANEFNEDTRTQIVAFYRSFKDPQEFFGERNAVVQAILERYKDLKTPELTTIPKLQYQWVGEVKKNGDQYQLDFHDKVLEAEQNQIKNIPVGHRTAEQQAKLDRSIIRTANWDKENKRWTMLNDEGKQIYYDRSTNRFIENSNSIFALNGQAPVPGNGGGSSPNNGSGSQGAIQKGVLDRGSVTLEYCGACHAADGQYYQEVKKNLEEHGYKVWLKPLSEEELDRINRLFPENLQNQVAVFQGGILKKYIVRGDIPPYKQLQD